MNETADLEVVKGELLRRGYELHGPHQTPDGREWAARLVSSSAVGRGSALGRHVRQ
jgi:hypothetical protein